VYYHSIVLLYGVSVVRRGKKSDDCIKNERNRMTVMFNTETTGDDVKLQQSCDGHTTSSCRLTPSGQFGDYVMLTTSRAVVVIGARQLTTQCEWNNITQAGASVWLEPLRL